MAPYRVLLSAIVGASIALSASDVNTRLDAARALQQEGDYPAAERILTAALREIPAGDVLRGIVLHELASVYHSQGRFAEAETRYLAALGFWPGFTGPEAMQRLRCSLSLASLYLETGRHTMAERLQLDRFEKMFPQEARSSPDFAKLNTTLGTLALAARRHGPAERYHLEAVRTWEAAGPGSIELAQSLSNLSLLYRASGRAREALECGQRALRIAETAMRPDHPEMVKLLANVASHNFAVYGASTAEKHFQAALALGERELGREHPVVGQILLDYASVLRKLGRKAEARECRNRANAILQASAASAPSRHTVHIRDLAPPPKAR